MVSIEGGNFYIFVTRRDNGYDIAYENEIISVRSAWEPGSKLFQGVINGKMVTVKYENLVEGMRLTYAGSTVEAFVRSPRVADLYKYMPERKSARKQTELQSPMAGLIGSVKVKGGDKVETGQPLVMIEAMKMENAIIAEFDAEIKSVNVKAGDSVQVGQVIIEFAA